MTTLHTDNTMCLSTLRLLGDYWALRIIDVLSDNDLRYCEIQRQIEGINTVTLSTRLRRLEASQLLNRTEASRAEVTYSLTELGLKVIPILKAIDKFSKAAKQEVDQLVC